MISVCQIGGRMQYAVARIFDSDKLLNNLYTDICFDKFPFSMIAELNLFSKFSTNRRVNISTKHIVHFPFLAFQYYINSKKAKSLNLDYQNYLWMEKRFSNVVLNYLDSDNAQFLYTFNTASYHIGKHQSEKKIILEQCSLPFGQYREKILNEFQKYAEWCIPNSLDVLMNESVEQFIEHEREEWIDAEFIIAPSESVKNSLIMEGVDQSKILNIPYGINIVNNVDIVDQMEKKKAKPFTISTIGYLELRKGIHHFLNVAKVYPGAKFKAIGQLGYNMSEQKVLELNKFVELTGHLDRNELYKEFQCMHVLLFLTIGEGSATVIYEALSLGIPVITTKEAGSIVEHEKSGFIVEPDNTPLIVHYIEKLRDQDYYHYVSLNALERSRFGSFNAYKERLLENLTFVK